MWIWRECAWSVGVVDAVFGDEWQVVEAAHELGDGQNVFLAVDFDALKVVFLPINAPHLAPVDVVFWRWNVQNGAKQVQGSVTFVVAEFPEFHRVYEVGFPRFLSRNLQYSRDLYAIDEHPSGNVWEVEFLAVVGAKLGIGRVIVAAQHIGEISEQGLLVVTVKRLQAEALVVEETH